MHLNLSSMANTKLCNNIVFPIIRRYVSATQQAATARATARSVVVRFIEDRRRKVQQDDIRLEPYTSKGVYTESGAIRPVNKRLKLTIYLIVYCVFLYLDAKTISSWYSESSTYRNSIPLYGFTCKQIWSIGT
jgi:acetoacetate decarboxylase